MAIFALGTDTDLNNINSFDDVKSRLFVLTEELRYMFNNLDPEDNYSEKARLTLVTDGERQASIEASLEGIKLDYVSKDGIVSAINLSEELVQIEASKIRLEGVVTVNGNFKVGLDGSIEASNGRFQGSISGSDISVGGSANDGYIVVYNGNGAEIVRLDKNGANIKAGTFNIGDKFKVDSNGSLTATDGTFKGAIEGSTINGSHIYGSYFGTTADDFYITSDGDDTVIGITGWTFENKIMYSDWIGDVENPASNGDTAGINGRTGNAGFRKLYLLDDWYKGSDGSMWDVTRTIRWLDNRLRSIEDFCASHNWNGEEGGGDGDDPGSGGDGHIDDGPVY